MGIITGALSSVLQWINAGLLQGGMQIMIAIIGELTFALSYDQIISMLPSIYGIVDETTGVAAQINLIDIAQAIAWAIVIVLILVEAIKYITLPMTENKMRNPIQLLIKAAIVVAILFFWDDIMRLLTKPFEIIGGRILGVNDVSLDKPLELFKGDNIFANLGNAVFSIFGEAIDLVSGAVINIVKTLFGSSTEGGGLMGNAFNDIAMAVLNFTLFTSILGAGLIIVERYLSLAITMTMGPMFMALSVSDTTSSSTKEWVKTVLVQYGAIIISWLGLIMFATYYNANIATHIGASSTATALGVLKPFHFVFCIALLQIIKNSEKYFNALGFRTIANKDTASAVKGAWNEITSATRMGMAGLRFAKGMKGDHKNDANIANDKSIVDNARNGVHSERLNSVNGPDMRRNSSVKGEGASFPSRSQMIQVAQSNMDNPEVTILRSGDVGAAMGMDAREGVVKMSQFAEKQVALGIDQQGNVTDYVGGLTYGLNDNGTVSSNFVSYDASTKEFGSHKFTEGSDVRVYSPSDITQIETSAYDDFKYVPYNDEYNIPEHWEGIIVSEDGTKIVETFEGDKFDQGSIAYFIKPDSEYASIYTNFENITPFGSTYYTTNAPVKEDIQFANNPRSFYGEYDKNNANINDVIMMSEGTKND